MAVEIETGKPARAAVVTGSSRGIGRAIAEKLAGAGYNVCVNCSSEGGREAVACALSRAWPTSPIPSRRRI